MNNQIKKIKEKLTWSDKILEKDFLEKLLNKFAPSYKIKDLTTLKLISPIKRGKYYLNNLNNEFENPFEIAKKYFEGEEYMFGGLQVYNKYGFTTQVPEWYTVYNKKVSGNRIIGKTKFILKKQRDSFFYGKILNREGKNRYNIMSKERAFIEMLREGKNFKEIPNGIDKEKLLSLVKKYTSKNIQSKINKLCTSKK